MKSFSVGRISHWSTSTICTPSNPKAKQLLNAAQSTSSSSASPVACISRRQPRPRTRRLPQYNRLSGPERCVCPSSIASTSSGVRETDVRGPGQVKDSIPCASHGGQILENPRPPRMAQPDPQYRPPLALQYKIFWIDSLEDAWARHRPVFGPRAS